MPIPTRNLELLSRLLSATLLTLLTLAGLYASTLGDTWPSAANARVWALEGLYALAAGVLHFLLWPLWRHHLRRAPSATRRLSVL